ncbi:MAG: serine hydrolase [Chitinophagaceae bacterium]|nr:serine hydrolase [Chitinophagaceae bacterium]
MQYYSYHDMSSDTYQNYFASLTEQGYRVISLSIHGDAEEPRYTAVWVKYTAGEWAGRHGIQEADYQPVFDTFKHQGYTPMIVTATGEGGDAVFALIVEKGNFGAWKARHGMNDAEFTAENEAAKSKGMMLKSYTIYGTEHVRFFAAIWHENPNWFKSHLHAYQNINDYQSIFTAETKLNLYRPSIVAIAPGDLYGAHFTDNIVGRVRARHHLNKDEYQNIFNEYSHMGLIPICIDAIDAGENARYTAIFAETFITEAKQWQIVGEGSRQLSDIDIVAENFMRRNAVRAMQICVGLNGNAVFNKAFNLSETAYRKASPQTPFLLASCSKMFVLAAIQRLIDTGQLTNNSGVYATIGGFSSPKDSRSDDITIQHIIDLQSGYTKAQDQTYNMTAIGRTLTPNRTVTKQDLAEYIYKNFQLEYTPGNITSDFDGYCNHAYVLLAMVVEKITGQDYFTFLNNAILISDGITEVKPWVTNKSPRDPDEILQEDEHLGESAIDVTSKQLTPTIYGGDGMVKEVALGSCSLAASARALTQFIHLHAVQGVGGRVVDSRSGSTDGASSWAQSRNDGIDWAYTINTRQFKTSGDVLDKLRSDINTILDTNSDLLHLIRSMGGRRRIR